MSAQAKTFMDVPEDYKHADAIEFLTNHKIINGYSNGSYHPERPISRAEFVTVALKAFRPDDIDQDARGCFPDVGEEDWYRAQVCTAASMSIISGYPDGSFKPANKITRAAAAKIVIALVFGQPSILENKFTDVDHSDWYSAFANTMAEKELLDFENNRFLPAQPLTRGELAEIVYRALLLIEASDEEIEKVVDMNTTDEDEDKEQTEDEETDLEEDSGQDLATSDDTDHLTIGEPELYDMGLAQSGCSSFTKHPSNRSVGLYCDHSMVSTAAFDDKGGLYISDPYYRSIWHVDANGEWTEIAIIAPNLYLFMVGETLYFQGTTVVGTLNTKTWEIDKRFTSLSGGKIFGGDDENAYYFDGSNFEIGKIGSDLVYKKIANPEGWPSFPRFWNGKIWYSIYGKKDKGSPGLYSMDPVTGESTLEISTTTGDDRIVMLIGLGEEGLLYRLENYLSWKLYRDEDKSVIDIYFDPDQPASDGNPTKRYTHHKGKLVETIYENAYGYSAAPKVFTRDIIHKETVRERRTHKSEQQREW